MAWIPRQYSAPIGTALPEAKLAGAIVEVIDAYYVAPISKRQAWRAHPVAETRAQQSEAEGGRASPVVSLYYRGLYRVYSPPEGSREPEGKLQSQAERTDTEQSQGASATCGACGITTASATTAGTRTGRTRLLADFPQCPRK
jgi:hypothetical protein